MIYGMSCFEQYPYRVYGSGSKPVFIEQKSGHMVEPFKEWAGTKPVGPGPIGSVLVLITQSLKF